MERNNERRAGRDFIIAAERAGQLTGWASLGRHGTWLMHASTLQASSAEEVASINLTRDASTRLPSLTRLASIIPHPTQTPDMTANELATPGF